MNLNFQKITTVPTASPDWLVFRNGEFDTPLFILSESDMRRLVREFIAYDAAAVRVMLKELKAK